MEQIKEVIEKIQTLDPDVIEEKIHEHLDKQRIDVEKSPCDEPLKLLIRVVIGAETE